MAGASQSHEQYSQTCPQRSSRALASSRREPCADPHLYAATGYGQRVGLYAVVAYIVAMGNALVIELGNLLAAFLYTRAVLSCISARRTRSMLGRAFSAS